jgi:hypothetical protein
MQGISFQFPVVKNVKIGHSCDMERRQNRERQITGEGVKSGVGMGL